MIVLHYHPLDGPLADRLRAALDPGIDLRVPGPGVNLDALAPLCDGVIAGRLSFDWLRAARNLRFQVVPYAGVPAQDRTQVAMLPAVTLYNSHFNADVTAEHAWALLLAAAKRLLPAHARLARGDWTPRYDGPLSARLAGARRIRNRLHVRTCGLCADRARGNVRAGASSHLVCGAPDRGCCRSVVRRASGADRWERIGAARPGAHLL